MQAAGTWHTIIARVPDAVLLELKAGPYDQNAAKEPAPWAPEEQTPEGNDFFNPAEKLGRFNLSHKSGLFNAKRGGVCNWV